MKVNSIKLLAIAVITLPMIFATVFKADPVSAVSFTPDDDVAAIYTTQKCGICHSPKAAKHFDPEADEAMLIEAILKGKKGQKPPYMPAYEPKGVTAEQAKALVDYMKSLRTPEGEN